MDNSEKGQKMSDEQSAGIWLAKEMLRQAEANCKSRVDGINKTRDRASSLLGWSLAALTGSMALVGNGFAQGSILLIPSLFLCTGFVAVCVCCICVLMPLKIERMTFYAAEIEDIARTQNVGSEEELQIAIADKLDKCEFKNAGAHEKRQALLKASWYVIIAAPIISLLVLIALG